MAYRARETVRSVGCMADRHDLAHVLDVLERRADAADTRTGLLMGLAGLVATLGGEGWLPLVLSARFFAGLAALTAVSALSIDVPPPGSPHAPRYAWCRVRLQKKVARLRIASRLVTAALVFAVIAATVEGVAEMTGVT